MPLSQQFIYSLKLKIYIKNYINIKKTQQKLIQNIKGIYKGEYLYGAYLHKYMTLYDILW